MIIYNGNKHLTCKSFNTDRVLRWILIIEEYGPDIEYNQGYKNIVADVLSGFTVNINQENTQESTYKK